jgi:aminopeptidase-like protein
MTDARRAVAAAAGWTPPTTPKTLDLDTPAAMAAVMEQYFDRLWPLMRSLTGEGVRQTLSILGEVAPIARCEVPTGTRTFDWTIPKEWVFRDAWVKDPSGRKIVDARQNTLAVLNGSVPFRGRVSRAELQAHLYSLAQMPDVIPYVTSYFAPQWGFCLPDRQRQALPDGEYEVCVDTDRVDGSLTVGEAVLPGETEKEMLIHSYVCHPSMANNELSGPLVAAFVYRRLAAVPRRRLSYRFVFSTETLGTLAYLADRGDTLRRNVVAGYVLTCIGDEANFTYKRSRRGDTSADRVAIAALQDRAPDSHRIIGFQPNSDERQYCSPAFNLPVGSLMRSLPAEYPQYHTSLDDKSVIGFHRLVAAVDLLQAIALRLENRQTWRTATAGEPWLGNRNMYPPREHDGHAETRRVNLILAMAWLHAYGDGEHDLSDIERLSGLPRAVIGEAFDRCLAGGTIVRT